MTTQFCRRGALLTSLALLASSPVLQALDIQRRPGHAPRHATRLDLGQVCPGETASWLLSSPVRLPAAEDAELLKADELLAIRVRTIRDQNGGPAAATQFLLELTPLRPGPLGGVLVIQAGPAPTDRLFFALAGQVKAAAACHAPRADIELSVTETVPAADAEAVDIGAPASRAGQRDLLPWEQPEIGELDEETEPRDDSWLWQPRPLEGATLAPPSKAARSSSPPATAKRPRRPRPRHKPDRAGRAELGASTADTSAMDLPAFSAEQLRELQRQPGVKMEAQRLRDLKAVPGVTKVDLGRPREAPCADHLEATRRIQQGLPACPDEAE